MNAEAKTLADELRTIARCIYIAVEKTVADDIAGKATKAADFLDRLSTPVEGVGLPRYCISACMHDGAPALLIGQGPVGNDEGEWVRHDDATALVERLRGALVEIREIAVDYTRSPHATLIDIGVMCSPTRIALLSETQASEGRDG